MRSGERVMNLRSEMTMNAVPQCVLRRARLADGGRPQCETRQVATCVKRASLTKRSAKVYLQTKTIFDTSSDFV